MLTLIKKQGDEHSYTLLQIGVINWISVRYVGVLRLVWMLIGSEIVSLNYAASGKSPLCSGASQFAAGYAAAQLSSDKRLSCTASDDVLSILRAHYKMQINLLFTLTLKPAIKKGAGLYVTRFVVSSGVVIVNDFADRGVVNTQHFLRQIVVGQ